MRIKHFALLSCVLLPLTASSATASELPPPTEAYPVGVSLQVSPDGQSKFVQTATNVRLYVSEKDSPGKSNCTGGCAHAWPPLAAEENSNAVGDWTVLQRADGLTQWAYKGQPVYLHYHDSASDPRGYKPSEGWTFLLP